MKNRMSVYGYEAALMILRMILLIAVIVRSYGYLFRELFAFDKQLPAHLITVCAGVIMILLSQLVFGALFQKAGIQSDNQMQINAIGGIVLLRHTLETLLYAPLLEEMVFREALYEELSSVTNRNHALWISCLLFGFTHVTVSLFQGNPANMLYLFVYAFAGFILHHVKRRCGSLCGSVLAHSLVNLIVMTV